MNYLTVPAFILWLYFLSVLKRSKLDFWYFLTGSVGMFIFMLIWLEPLLVNPLIKAVSAVAGIVGGLSGMYDSYFEYGLLFISNSEANISLYIDYECSGIIEIMAFSSMLWFFGVYKIHEKIVINILGILCIFAANIIRIFVISALIRSMGNDIYYLAHTVFGRIVFYIFSVALYFYVFTRPQIVRQKVGNFNYETH